MLHPDGGATIEELHRTYDGPIPKHLRDAANAGGYARLAYLEAQARTRFWHEYLRKNRLIRNHHAEINARRGFPPHPDQEKMNARDLAYALNGLQNARSELRRARAALQAVRSAA